MACAKKSYVWVGVSFREITGPNRIQTAPNVATIPPITIAITTPICVPRTPPMREPTGIVPQTIVRMVAFIRH